MASQHRLVMALLVDRAGPVPVHDLTYGCFQGQTLKTHLCIL